MTDVLDPPATAASTTRSVRPLLALVALSLPMALVAVDISVLNIALPVMGEALRASAAELLWMADSYNFLVAGAMLVTGAIADRIGRRRMIMICAAAFALASAAGAFATTPELVIVARGLMGLAGSAIMPAAMALLSTLFPDPKARMQAMGASMTVFLVAMAAAPFLGGILLAHFWWGAVFLLGVPVMVVTLVTVPRVVPESRSEQTGPIDVVSAAECLVAILAVVWSIKAFATTGLQAAPVIVLVSGIAIGAIFVRRQSRLANPLLDLALVRRPAVGAALATLLITAMLMGGSSVFVNLFLQDVQGLTPFRAAAWTLPAMIAMIAASNVGPALARRFPEHGIVLTMLVIMAGGFTMLALAPATWAGLPLVALSGAMTTFGIGAAFPLLMGLVLSATPADRAGAGAAMAQLSNELGIALGMTVLGSFGTLVYRAAVGRPGTAAGDNVVAGVAEALANGDDGLLEAVRGSFASAVHAVGWVAVVAMIGVVALYALTRRASMAS